MERGWGVPREGGRLPEAAAGHMSGQQQNTNQDKWFTWKDGSWAEDSPRISFSTFVGSGTRYLSDAGHKAIEELFANSFA